MIQGRTLARANNTFKEELIVQANPIRIFNKACPDIMFAKSRILKLSTLAK